MVKVMTYFFIFLAGSFTALSNLFIRKSIEKTTASMGDPFLIQRLMASAFFMICLSLFYHKSLIVEPKMASIGLIAGILLGALMWSTGRAIENGPPALSFAIINAACIAPPLLMSLLFGSTYGYEYSYRKGLGALFVVTGIFIMNRNSEQTHQKRSWAFWVALAFALHCIFLSFFQWRALLLDPNIPLCRLVPFHLHANGGDCFALLMFLTAALVQSFFQSKTESSSPPISHSQILLWGCLGGLINGLAGFCTVKATEVATTSHERALIFPLFCVCLITLCNLWGEALYQEKIDWLGTFLCFAGILIALS